MIILHLKHNGNVLREMPHRRVPETGEELTYNGTDFTVVAVEPLEEVKMPIVQEHYTVTLERTQ